MGFLVSFVKNDEIRPSSDQLPNNSRMTREQKLTQFSKGTTHGLF